MGLGLGLFIWNGGFGVGLGICPRSLKLWIWGSHMKMKVKDWKWKKHPNLNTGKQTLKFAQPQNCLPKFFVVLAMRTTAMSLQSQIGGDPETLEPPWQEFQVRWTQLLQEDEDAPRNIRFQLNFNGTLNHNEHQP